MNISAIVSHTTHPYARTEFLPPTRVAALLCNSISPALFFDILPEYGPQTSGVIRMI
jgi:hypothetical protein